MHERVSEVLSEWVGGRVSEGVSECVESAWRATE